MMSRLAQCACLASLVLASPFARADGCGDDGPPLTIYGLAADGRMSIDGTIVDTYASEFSYDVDVDDDFLIIVFPGGIYVDGGIDVDIDNPDQLWTALAVDGADRYAMRRDGRIKRNDKSYLTLPEQSGPVWLDLDADGGHTYAVRTDGLTCVDDDVLVDLPSDGFAFRRVRYEQGDVLTLRADGALFRDTATSPVLRFQAGRGDLGLGDGLTIETSWVAFARDPNGNNVFALRCDGHVFRGNLAAGGTPEEVATLPYDRFTAPYIGQIYVDLAIDADGRWYAMTGDGRVYTGDSDTVPLYDFPGSAENAGRGFTDIEILGEDVYGLRTDGRVYRNAEESELVDMPREGHASLAVSDVSPPPVEEGAKKPKATIIKTKTVVGTPLHLPVVANDADTPDADLAVTPLLPLPPGATWDAEDLVLHWDSPGPAGKYTFTFTVSDGVNVKEYAYQLKLSDPDPKPDKNLEPLLAKYEKGQAIVGDRYVVPIVVDDPDGDVLTVDVDPTRYPFSAGASWDPVSREFSWCPTADDVGDVTAKFVVSDGRKSKNLKLTFKVKNSLIFD